MSTAAPDPETLLAALLKRNGYKVTDREPVQIEQDSRLERLHLADSTSVVYKYAAGQHLSGAIALGVAARAGLPVPAVHATLSQSHTLGMILEDLGHRTGEPCDELAAHLAARTHRAFETWDLPLLDRQALRALPKRILMVLGMLSWTGAATDAARAIHSAAKARSDGSRIAPYGLCHGRWRPAALHIGDRGAHMIGFSRAFRGPGLLDLADWPLPTAEPEAFNVMIEHYIAAGGPADAGADRGGLSAADWATGWHQVRLAERCAQQVASGRAQGNELAAIATLTGHLEAAARLLKP